MLTSTFRSLRHLLPALVAGASLSLMLLAFNVPAERTCTLADEETVLCWGGNQPATLCTGTPKERALCA